MLVREAGPPPPRRRSDPLSRRRSPRCRRDPRGERAGVRIPSAPLSPRPWPPPPRLGRPRPCRRGRRSRRSRRGRRSRSSRRTPTPRAARLCRLRPRGAMTRGGACRQMTNPRCRPRPRPPVLVRCCLPTQPGTGMEGSCHLASFRRSASLRRTAEQQEAVMVTGRRIWQTIAAFAIAAIAGPRSAGRSAKTGRRQSSILTSWSSSCTASSESTQLSPAMRSSATFCNGRFAPWIAASETGARTVHAELPGTGRKVLLARLLSTF